MALEVDIRKRLGDFQLDVAFASEGGVLALLGASGCGKSMTLKCIAGIETPDSGRIALDGRVLFDSDARINLPPQQRRVGYLFQQYALFPNMTVRQNIAAGIRQKAGREEKVNAMVRAMYLAGEEDKYPAQLSGGQQQRVALARILASEPDLLMLDEPFTALDSYLRWQLELELTDTLAAYGRPVLFVSHSRDEVYRLCQRVCLMEQGRSEPVMPVRTLFDSPGTVSAALLSGCKNFAHARRLDAHRVHAEEWGVTLACEADVPLNVQAIGIRAHHIVPCTEAGDNTVDCEVARVVDDVFSTVVMLRPVGAPSDGDWRMLRMEMDKAAFAQLGAPQGLRVRLAPGCLMPLTGGGDRDV